MGKPQSLTPEDLAYCCDPESLDFETTGDLDHLTEFIGQNRAVQAVQFGVGMRRQGYNIFAYGPAGTGKLELISRSFKAAALEQDPPDDWIYLTNFEDGHKPHALRLPAGMGAVLRRDLEALIKDLQHALPAAFEGEEYRDRVQEIQAEVQERQNRELGALRQRAEREGLAMVGTPSGLIVAPIRDGEVISPEEFKALPEEERSVVEKKMSDLQEELQRLLLNVPAMQREARVRLQKLRREMAEVVVGPLVEELRQTYTEHPRVTEYLEQLQNDVIENLGAFVSPEAEDEEQDKAPTGRGGGAEGASRIMRRYKVNLLVDHSQSQGAPVVYEDNPTLQNLVGRVEHLARMGTLTTDFTLIKAGALHRANQGFLIIEARELLQQPYAWEGLKRALRSKQIRIESPAQMMSMISTATLDPEPIPLDVKVALIGEPKLYHLLSAHDPEFVELFKVAADFDEQMDRNPENQLLYARMIANLVHKHGLRPFDRSAVARVIDHSARMVSDREKLSTRMNNICDVLREADYWAEKNGRDIVTRGDVQQAIDAAIYRADKLRDRVQEQILRETLLIDTQGEKIGQLNGLSVIQLGDFAFGRPSRITARVRVGKGDVVDIEREVELGGPIHSKGVLILTALLAARYSANQPLSLSASLVFEQSYSGVEGDSASSAELYTLLSAIANVPLKQYLAVTGSVNQHGEIQAIGGVNEKIEGFFDLCKARGLSGEQGVLIPRSNLKHLMLRQDVIDAVRDGQFHVFPVDTIDQGLELLTGLPAGEPDSDGRYPADSLNGRIQTRLVQMAEYKAAAGSQDVEASE